MNIQAEKLEIMKMILETDNPEILESVKSLFTKGKTNDFWNALSYEQKEDILEGVKEIDNGDTIDYETFMKSHRK